MLSFFKDQLKSISVVTPGTATGGYDADGRKTPATPITVTVQGVLQPIGIRERALMQASGGQGPVPSFVAWLPITAPVSGMNYHLEVGDNAYYPWADAQDVGGAGQFYRVQLGSPGQRRS